MSNGAACSMKKLANRRHPLNSAPPYASIRFICNKYRPYRKRKNASERSTGESATLGSGHGSFGDGGADVNVGSGPTAAAAPVAGTGSPFLLSSGCLLSAGVSL